MKRINLLLAISILFCLNAYTQTGDEKCITCNGNKVDIEKGASALGTKNFSTGENSFASGFQNEANGDYSIALGYLNKSTNGASFSAGYSNLSQGIASISLGTECVANGKGAFAAGMGSKANGLTSFAFGQYVETGTSTTSAFVIGHSPTSYNQLVNLTSYSFMVGFKSSKPTFFVGPAGNSVKTGKISIGNTTNPLAKLHIKADSDEDASLLLEPTGSAYNAKVLFGNGGHSISGKAGENMIFSANENDNFLFENGNVQIQDGFQLVTNKVNSLGTKLQLFDNTNGITITNGGKVGIGISNPSHTLTVLGNMWLQSTATFGSDIIQSAGKFVQTTTIKAANANGLNLTDQNGVGLFVDDGGNVGIGKTPDYTFDVNGSINFTGLLKSNGQDLGNWLKTGSDIYYDGGNVGIGTTNTGDYKLAVNGKINAKELKISESVPSSDYVFEKDYELITITELENFISVNKHLPEVPSAAEFKENGYSVGEMDDLLLRKVEELTLYIIQQQKEIEDLKVQISK